MIVYRYFALPVDAVSGTGEIRRDAVDQFFAIAKRVTGLNRAEVEALTHVGHKIEQGGFRIWAEPINPFKPARLI